MIGFCPLLIFTNASSMEYHAARSTSGNSAVRPERGGHSSEKALLLSEAGSKSPSHAQATIVLPRRLLVRAKIDGIRRRPPCLSLRGIRASPPRGGLRLHRRGPWGSTTRLHPSSPRMGHPDERASLRGRRDDGGTTKFRRSLSASSSSPGPCRCASRIRRSPLFYLGVRRAPSVFHTIILKLYVS